MNDTDRDFKARIETLLKTLIDILKKLPAKTKVISMAPILGPFSTDIDFEGIDAVGIVPETWGYKRPYDPEWGENIRRQCLEQEVSFGTESILYVKEGQKGSWSAQYYCCRRNMECLQEV